MAKVIFYIYIRKVGEKVTLKNEITQVLVPSHLSILLQQKTITVDFLTKKRVVTQGQGNQYIFEENPSHSSQKNNLTKYQ